ncbi:MAG: cation transporter [Thermomicrobiales bacterium]|nr:cation transporter [Thermomicrobiales bacterium]MCO5223547.1 cation diffusion facilitator family transporter [Thermomicrobiales bacterium]
MDVLLAARTDQAPGASLLKWGWLSIGAAIITIALKFGAYLLTDSIGLLSDAVESLVNLVAAGSALFALWYSTRPVDRSHNYGHQKIEFFSAAVEGGLILVAAVTISWYSIQRLITPRPIESVSLGLFVALLATVINLLLARAMLRVAREHDSVVLHADGQHLMTDVWTTVGVVAALILASMTGWQWVDPIVGLAVAVNILRIGFGLLRSSFDGLMDRAVPVDEEQQIRMAIEQLLPSDVTYHALRTRRAGSHRIVDLHLLVPGTQHVRDAHQLSKRIESAIDEVFPGTETIVHIEPLEDPDAWVDSELIELEQTHPAFDLPDFLAIPGNGARGLDLRNPK